MVEFIKEGHIYLNDYGIIIPSCTQIINWKFGSGYDDVPKDILQKKAEYGTRIHALIEAMEKTGEVKTKNPYEEATLIAYEGIKSKLPKVVNNEELVCFQNRLAGQIDIVYEDGSLGDIKTYATVDEHALLKLKWQLSLYMFCKYGNDNKSYELKNGHLIHLPKSMQYSHREIEIYPYIDCLALLEEYEANN